MSEAQTTYAVLDTNDFLEHRRFTEIDWLDLVGADRVTLVVPWQVVAELDDNKSNNRYATKRERARELLPLIEHYAQVAVGEEVRAGVTMEFFSQSVDDICRENDLSPTVPDHVVIASAISIERLRGKGAVVLITGDTGMRMTARRVGLAVISMPESLRLPQALDEAERERRELERELQRFQSRRPQFTIGWAGEEKIIRVALTPHSKASPQALDQVTSQRVSKIALPPPYILGNAENPRHADAVSRVTEFRKKFRKYVEDLDDARLRDSLTFETRISLKNLGTKPATDVRLRVEFPDGIVVADEKPKYPAQPAAPSFGVSLLDSLNPNLGLASFETLIRHPIIPSAPGNIRSWVENDGRTVVLRVTKLHQSYTASTDSLYISFDEAAGIRSFAAHFHLVADDVVEPIEGTLSVVITDANVDNPTPPV